MGLLLLAIFLMLLGVLIFIGKGPVVAFLLWGWIMETVIKLLVYAIVIVALLWLLFELVGGTRGAF